MTVQVSQVLFYLLLMSTTRNKEPQLLGTLISKQSTSSGDPVLLHIESLRRLQQVLQEHIEPALMQHCRIANCKNGSLTLATSTAAWASRLRYTVPEILDSLRDKPASLPIKSIRVIVTPEQSTRNEQPSQEPCMSLATAEVLQQIADSIDDSELSASIKRLCRHSSMKQ